MALRFFYRNVYLHGLSNIPDKGGAVLIANHAASVMDALLLGVLLKRPVHFFARGDMFKNPVTVWLMKKIHMMPVHHHQGGRQTLHHNKDSFTYAKQLLDQGALILFFPEGISHTEYHLLPFKKGIFRIAFEWMNATQWKIPLPCIPIGITYDSVKEAHQNVTVNIGVPFSLLSFQPMYQQHIPSCLLQSSKTAYQQILPLVLHLEHSNRIQVASQIIHIKMNSWPEYKKDWICKDVQRFKTMKHIASAINSMSDLEWEQAENHYHQYQATMNAVGCNDKVVSNQFHFTPQLYDYFFLMAGFPLFILSWLLSSLPLKTARLIADKKVYRMDFYAWIWMTTAAVLYLLWWLLLFIITSLFSLPVAVLASIALLITGVWITIYSKHFKMMMKWWKWKNITAATKLKLTGQREKLLTMVNDSF